MTDPEKIKVNSGIVPQPRDRVKLEPRAHIKYLESLQERIIGQPEATAAFAYLAVRIKSGIRKPSGIIDSKFVAGPSGVGKTETVLTLARMFDGSGEPPKIIKVDCGLLQQAHETSKLVGSPAGYVGSEGSGTYIEPVLSPENIARNAIEYTDTQGRKQRLIIILFDEFEKAHPHLQRLILASLDKGTIQTASNRNVDLSDSVIFFTSNIGNREIEQQRVAVPIGFVAPHDPKESNTEKIVIAEMQKVFPPEFRGRINDVIVFNHLTKEATAIIARMKFGELQEMFKKNGINTRLSPSDRLIEYIAQAGLNPSEGARAVIKLINREISDSLIAAHTEYNINGNEVILDLDETEKPALYFGEKLEDEKKVAESPETLQTQKEPARAEEDETALVPKEDIENLHARLVAKLLEELKELEMQPEIDERDKPWLGQLMHNIEYIYDLSDRIPELDEYLERWGRDIGTGFKFYDANTYFRLIHWNPSLTVNVFSYNVLNLYLGGERPNMSKVLRELTIRWDQDNRTAIINLGRLTKKEIVKGILKFKQV